MNLTGITHGNLDLERYLRSLSDQLGFRVGNVFSVLTSTEPNYADLMDKGVENADGSAFVQPTVEAAYALAVSNRNDVILLSANGTSNKTAAMLTVAKNRLHFLGLDPTNGRKIGARSLLSNTGAGAATDVAMVYITGTGCSFHNISFKNNWTVAENLFSVKDFGIQTFFENCDIESLGSAHLTNANAASLNLGGNECIYKNCTIGQDTLLVTSTAGQQLLVTNRGTTGTKSTRSRFDSCRFQSYTNDTTHVFVRFGATSVDRDITFDSCEFSNSLVATSSATLAVAMMTPSTVAGSVNVAFPRVFGATNLATSAVGNTGIYVVSPVLAAAASDCVAVQAS